MIHQYQNNGYYIVLDVNSGSVHVVDRIAYDVIACLERNNPRHTPETLKTGRHWSILRENFPVNPGRSSKKCWRPWRN